MNKILVLLSLLLFTFGGEAQQKANYKLAEKLRNVSFGSLIGKYSMSVFPKQINDTDKFWFEFTTEEGKNFYFVDPAKGEKRLLFNNTDIAQGVSLITRKGYNEKDLRISNMEFSKDLTKMTFSMDGRYEFDFKTKKVQALEKKDHSEEDDEVIYSWMTFSPDRKYILYAKGHNLYIRGNKAKGVDTTEVQLTTDGEKYYSFARDPEDDQKDEAETNARWFKDSRHIYVVREDSRKLKDMFVINSLTKRPTLETYRYEMPGEKDLCQYELWIIDIEKKTANRVSADKWTDQYIQVLQPGEKGDKLFFQRFKRTWDEVDICVVNTETLEVKELIHEVDKPYRDYHMQNTVILNDGKDILFRSERTGWGHYYHYDGEGRLKNVITSGPWVAGQVAAIDTVGRTIYLYGFGREKGVDPYYYMLYKASIDKEGVTLLTPENAQHGASFLSSKRYFVDTYSRVDMEPKIVLKNNQGKVIMELAKPDTRRLKELGWRAPERFTVKAADGLTDIYGIMWKPADFDPNKKYPIISSVYPGPFFEYVNTSFRVDDSYNMRLAQLGFIVVSMGHRGGSPMRGKFYHRYGYGKLRDYPLADDKYAIEQLADRYAYIDLSKVGIFGHSGGGFMSTAALCTYPDFYTAAVSSAGNHDNNIFNRGWSEIYHGVKEAVKTVKGKDGQDSTVYTYSCKVPTNMELAKRLKGHLLLVTGDMDKNVHPANTLRMVDALIKAKKNFEMIVLPGNGHGFGGKADAFFERKLWYHFAKYLLGDESTMEDVELQIEN
ncbi:MULTISPECIES: S9 family peptidase [Butyricimonas]|uniref:S9 family peptidase n=1 Tax=Butyricimonas TaxID=574697 RepID=UPI0020801036|nr:DPP IV N-terminal domain-containing protein [Butyricimonas paravirosa]BDF56518.1 X-Pro dipeptidyl-peptidase [Odoribacteraceae bacterium]GKH95382.1 X-Pro dipeptidyl-peptidase [Odoribacteraceae bacterium]GKH98006.1 X-Pro dipeptidyl-peptidase [Odoribacteraceae bacterium]GKI01199.1 X-Pro dipeptidyl-peptidase [Odoribacteraceae bacterium]